MRVPLSWLKEFTPVTTDARDRAAVRALGEVLDSLGLDLGATFSQPARAGFASRSGLEVGLGVEIPILATASGPWIDVHGGLRWSEEALAIGTVRGADDRYGYLAVTLSWHQFATIHGVDGGDRAPR